MLAGQPVGWGHRDGMVSQTDRGSIMRSEDIEPLETGLWTQRIGQLAGWPVADQAGMERILRHAFHLVQLAPRPLRHLIHCTCAEGEFETLLEAGAFDAAALRLIGHRTPFILRKTAGDEGATAEAWQGGVWPSRVWPGADGDRPGASGPSLALALLRAWIGWISTLDGSEDEAPRGPRAPDAAGAGDRLATQH